MSNDKSSWGKLVDGGGDFNVCLIVSWKLNCSETQSFFYNKRQQNESIIHLLTWTIMNACPDTTTNTH